jgi:hypothetical protein
MKPNVKVNKRRLPARNGFLVLAVACVLVFQLYPDNTQQTLTIQDLQIVLGGSYMASTDSDYANPTTLATTKTITSTDFTDSDFENPITPAKKTIVVSNSFTTIDQDSSKATMNRTKIFFIHVGKTGGTTLRETVLRFGCRLYGQAKAKANCEQSIKTNGESVLGKQTTGLFHYERMIPKSSKQREKMDLLYVVREPIARFTSSYEFINPHNCILDKKERAMKNKCDSQQRAQNFPASFDSQFYYDCFPTIQAFLNYKPPKILDESDQKSSKKCRKLWRYAFHPGQSEYAHMSANYQYYTTDMGLLKKDRKVWVIRTENLWEDVSHVDTLLGGTGNFSHVHRRTINKQSTQDGASPSTNHVPLPFCCGLLPDMLAFRDIINRADNFNDQEKRETNERSWSRCNVTSWDMLETKCGGKG